ncbi:phage virion morphogenesis protein [Psychrobacter lutiphocae]|uniref:phage virion morphogenesis protein n=1 Tax=Psychrobacter lutiphocae TaxID=540500 RepID=UPI0003A9CDDD|nr:phage virion morphogenesis protein [Psychrobacter lutiphocae]
MISVQLEGVEQVEKQLLRVQQRVGDMRPLMADIGEHLVNSTHDNFESSTAPDGSKWEANSPVTFARMLGKSDTGKSGRINKRGVNKVANKRPLIMSHTLMQSIHYQETSTNVTVGTNMVYGAMMHYGGSKAKFPHLWGDIPARPYLGIGRDDGSVIKDMIGDYLLDALNNR